MGSKSDGLIPIPSPGVDMTTEWLVESTPTNFFPSIHLTNVVPIKKPHCFSIALIGAYKLLWMQPTAAENQPAQENPPRGLQLPPPVSGVPDPNDATADNFF
jgi:hypothetical protein